MVYKSKKDRLLCDLDDLLISLIRTNLNWIIDYEQLILMLQFEYRLSRRQVEEMVLSLETLGYIKFKTFEGKKYLDETTHKAAQHCLDVMNKRQEARLMGVLNK